MVKDLVSVIIVNWNGIEHLKSCLSSLSRINYKKTEIIVVDNGSQDGSYEFIRQKYSRIIVIRNHQNLGFSRANNQGIRKSKGEYILFLNNDTKVSKNFLNILIKELASDKKMGACQPKILHWEKPGRLDSIGSFLTNTGFLFHLGFEAKDTKRLDKKIKLFSGKGSCLLFKRQVLEKIGYFNEDFFAYFEETDLCWRLWLYGYYLLYIPEAVIWHKTWGTTSRLPQDFISFHAFRNRISSLITNLELGNLLLILPIHLLTCFFIVGCYFISGKFKNGFAIVWAVLASFKNLPQTLKTRKHVQSKIREVSDEKLFLEIMRNPKISFYLYILKYSFIRSKAFSK